MRSLFAPLATRTAPMSRPEAFRQLGWRTRGATSTAATEWGEALLPAPIPLRGIWHCQGKREYCFFRPLPEVGFTDFALFFAPPDRRKSLENVLYSFGLTVPLGQLARTAIYRTSKVFLALSHQV